MPHAAAARRAAGLSAPQAEAQSKASEPLAREVVESLDHTDYADDEGNV